MRPITLSVSEARELDRRATEELGIPSFLLMENAGRGLADNVQTLLDKSPKWIDVVVLAGGGMNGGDGLVAARHLAQRHAHVSVYLAAAPEALKGDAALNYRIISKLDVPIASLASFPNKERELSGKPVIFVDALLGTGFHGAPRGEVAEIIRKVNFLRKYHNAKISVVAADVPSGLDADRGPVGGDVLIADMTVTFGCLKPGLLLRESKPFVGRIEVVDIGIPEKLLTHKEVSS